ncbi:hypothetical protein PRIPAC_79304 [Pristionchus pacificus]|uniref:Aspartate aminotransferase n=1 Tax=Pristionchus pacificus TaxID=54126 RepID=A0A2A6CJU2_PRIPA|nr:hypothetical protein PRIPAC_79304 [Pristionchus pacificus]|eukprot:PDM78494.1 hypothetical protein PRIPAC_31073 [Pristionchus pacificus]
MIQMGDTRPVAQADGRGFSKLEMEESGGESRSRRERKNGESSWDLLIVMGPFNRQGTFLSSWDLFIFMGPFYCIRAGMIFLEYVAISIFRAAQSHRSVIILQGCAHNPTGMDPTREQWRRICDVVKRRRLFPFFDIANQGLASGDPEADAWAIRYFVSQGVELLVAQSFAKNFGLYNDRVGNLTIVVNDKTTIAGIKSQATLCSVGNYSNPPAHGALIVYKILTTRELREEWLDSLKVMVSRHKDVRTALKEQLDSLGTAGSWSHITQQTGMYCYAGLTPEQCNRLIEEHKVYLLRDGRAALCGLNSSNVEYVARAIDDVIRSSAN